MMQAWSFAARMVDEVGRVLRALGKNRYVREIDHHIHWAVDAALVDVPGFAEHARRFEARRAAEPGLEPGSRDPSLWREASVEEVVAALTALWEPSDATDARRVRLLAALEGVGIGIPDHPPFGSPPDEPPFPELITCDWVLYAVDELDADRHAGALAALEELGEPVETPSDPVYVEGPALGPVELAHGAPHGVLEDDWLVWADGPYAYVDYLFRGVSKVARLVDPPEGPRDLDPEDQALEG